MVVCQVGGRQNVGLGVQTSREAQDVKLSEQHFPLAL